MTTPTILPRRRLSLRAKVISLALASITLINLVSMAGTTTHAIEKKRQELAGQAAWLARVQARSLGLPIWNLDTASVQDMVSALSMMPGFARAQVIDTRGIVIAGVEGPDAGNGETLAGDDIVWWRDSQGQVKALGRVRVELSTKPLDDFISRQLGSMLVVLGLSCTTVALALMMAFRLVGQPLGRLARITERLGRGQHDLSVPEQNRDDEIGAIARAVEASRQQLATIDALRQEQTDYLRMVFANSADAIIEVDHVGRIEAVNPSAERIFALPAQILAGMRLGRLLPGLDLSGTQTVEIESPQTGGGIRTLSVSSSPFLTDDTQKTLVIAHDISERKEAERALVAARESAETASRTKSAFLANMSHEIRTPMNAIIGLTRLVLGSTLTEKQRDQLGKVLSSAHGLLTIINDILDLSKIEAGKLTIETTSFQLDDLFEELADLNALRAREKGLELIFDLPAATPLALMGDPIRLRQVLVNLIGNAIKFTPAGEVTVTVTPVDGGDDWAMLRFGVRDTGIGLSPDQCRGIFDSFSQGDISTTRRFGGTGLGLAISRNLVGLMGGTIGVDSQLGQGSHFWFTARFGLDAQAADGALNLSCLPDGVRVLVVETNPTARQVLDGILDSFGYDRHMAADPADALTAAQRARTAGQGFTLALVADRLHEGPGTDLIRALKSSNPGLAAVLMGAPDEAQDSETDEIRLAVADGLLSKPVTPSRLLDAILTILPAQARGRMSTRRNRNNRISRPLDLRGTRLLLVEDNQINRDLAMEVLKVTGADIAIATNGADAVNMVEASHFDVVLMDCQMPVMDGYAATARLRAQGGFQSLPIIAMTANAMMGDREKCLSAGMNDYITKPFDEIELIETLRRWVHPHISPDQSLPSPPLQIAAPAAVETDRLDELADILDIAQGLSRHGGNHALYQRNLVRFAQDHRNFATHIRQAVVSDEQDTARRLAHTLKGLSGTLGATALHPHAAALEHVLARGLPYQAELDSTLDVLSPLMDRIETTLPVLVPANGGQEQQQPAPLLPPGTLDRLRQALEQSDLTAADELTQLCEQWPTLSLVLAPVAELISRYQFDSALTALTRALPPDDAP